MDGWLASAVRLWLVGFCLGWVIGFALGRRRDERSAQQVMAELATCRPGLAHRRRCAPIRDSDTCACGCSGDDYWCMSRWAEDGTAAHPG